MRYRKLTTDGDYSFGSSSLDFYIDIEAVAQAIKTRLELLKESFWRDLSDGLPLFQQILGTPGSPANLEAVTNIITQRIKGTTGVLLIVSNAVTWNATDRQYFYTATVQTLYSTTIITGTL